MTISGERKTTDAEIVPDDAPAPEVVRAKVRKQFSAAEKAV